MILICFFHSIVLYESKRKEREGVEEGEKEEGGKGFKAGEGKRKCMTTKHRYHSSFVNFILLTVRLFKIGRSTIP